MPLPTSVVYLLFVADVLPVSIWIKWWYLTSSSLVSLANLQDHTIYGKCVWFGKKETFWGIRRGRIGAGQCSPVVFKHWTHLSLTISKTISCASVSSTKGSINQPRGRSIHKAHLALYSQLPSKKQLATNFSHCLWTSNWHRIRH